MVRRMVLTDPQFVHLLQRRAAAPADDGRTIAADQRIRHGQRGIADNRIRFAVSFVVGHYCYTSNRNCCS